MANDVKKEYAYTDSSEVEHRIHIYEDSFNFAQKDKSIHDTKFLTKPTTFLKDAFKRFCKNKSSVAGAIILGVLLLGSILIPFISPYDIDVQHPQETFLEPKLFPTGTGFWDGTKRMYDVPVDSSTLAQSEDGQTYGYPFEAQYPRRSVLNLSPAREGYVNTATASADGGYLNLINNNPIVTEDEESIARNAIYMVSPVYNFNLENENYDLEITFLADEVENYYAGDYQVSISYNYDPIEAEVPETPEEPAEPTDPVETLAETGTEDPTIDDPTTEDPDPENPDPENPDEEEEEPVIDANARNHVLKSYDDTPNYVQSTFEDEVGNTINLNTLRFEDILSGLRNDETIDLTTHTISEMRIRIDLAPRINTSSSLFIQNINLYDGELAVSPISWNDANDFILTTSSSNAYWQSTGVKSLYHGISYVCDFTFDTYAVPYGERDDTVNTTTLVQYVENGWLDEGILTRASSGAYSILDEWYYITIQYGGGNPSSTVRDAIAATEHNLQSYFTDISDEKLPIVSVNGVMRRSFTSNGQTSYSYTLYCTVSGYKLLGYESMPTFLAGTDNYGYDMLKRTFTGLLTSLGLGVLIFAICFTFGLVYGAICGYFGGNIDIALQRFCDLLSGIPRIVIMTLCILNMGSNFLTFIIAMCLTGWIGTASLTRTQFYRFRDREYTLASRTLGASNVRLIFKHILPNAMGTIITSAVLMIPSVIFSEATISYLGLGFQDMQSLGVVLSDNQTYLNTYAYLILFPSVIMALIMISFNLFGNGLRDAFNPSLKGSD